MDKAAGGFCRWIVLRTHCGAAAAGVGSLLRGGWLPLQPGGTARVEV